MQNNKFYAGHSMEWMNKFMETIPKKKKYRLNIAYCLAEAINHLSILKKRNDNLVLNHDILKEFNLWYKHIPRYLLCFEKAGLIETSLKNGAAPKIKLLLVDPLRYVPYYKQSNSTKKHKGNKRNLDQNDQPPRPKRLGNLDQNDQVETLNFEGPKEPPKEPPKQGKGVKGGQEPREGAKGGGTYDR